MSNSGRLDFSISQNLPVKPLGQKQNVLASLSFRQMPLFWQEQLLIVVGGLISQVFPENPARHVHVYKLYELLLQIPPFKQGLLEQESDWEVVVTVVVIVVVGVVILLLIEHVEP